MWLRSSLFHSPYVPFSLRLPQSWQLAKLSCAIPSPTKKADLTYYECCCWISSTSCEKQGFNPVSRASPIRGLTSLIIDWVFLFILAYFIKKKSLQRWVVVGMPTKAEITFSLGFQCSRMLVSDIKKLAKTLTATCLFIVKIAEVLHVYRTWF